MACKNTARGGDLIRELFRLGVPKSELKPFALARLTEYIRSGYSLDAIQNMARQFSKSKEERLKLITSLEIEQMFITTKYDMMHEVKTNTPSPESPASETETEEEQIKRGLEMAALYE